MVDDEACVGGEGDAGGVAAEAVGEIDHGVEVGPEGVGEPLGLTDAGLKGEVAA